VTVLVGSKKETVLTIRLSHAERALISAAAEMAGGLGASEWARAAIVAAATA